MSLLAIQIATTLYLTYKKLIIDRGLKASCYQRCPHGFKDLLTFHFNY